MTPTLPHHHRRAKGTFRYEPKRRAPKHVIEDVGYAEAKRSGIPMELARLECTCGWVGTAGGFQRHRADHGERIVWESGSSREAE